MIRRPPRSTLFPYDALPISQHRLRRPSEIRWIGELPDQRAFGLGGSPRFGADATERDPCPGDVPSTNRDHQDRKSTRLNSSHSQISYAVFCLKKKKIIH